MSAYREFTGKTVEEALRLAREAFGAGLEDLDFEILTPGSRGVLGMGAEPARIVAAPRAELGGAAPKREAAAARPLPPPPPRDDREDRPRFGDRDRGPRRDDRGPRRDDRGPRRDDRGPRADDRGPRRDDRDRGPRPDDRGPRPDDRGPRPEDRGPRPDDRPRFGDRDRGPRRDDRGDRAPRRDDHEGAARGAGDLSEREAAEVEAARGSVAAERAELEAAEASPEALAAGKVILERLLVLMGFDVVVTVEASETSRLNVTGEGDEREALGALIGRKGERLSALQHLVNLMLSKEMGGWTRVLVDVEDYRGRRERQLREIAERAARRVVETGKMLQLEPMPALERRWVHLALRNHPDVVTQSIGEEPSRRIVVLPRPD
ncbi:MAG TPA: RNA-binding cell elongation regulator Jag/EloR [Candidatus Sulfomarinibacteraceae bacterium]|nr:RNA-binding cell elongation regulator Jag/EloR [Candidatus Sulfomarinibacteraceae bacterium]